MSGARTIRREAASPVLLHRLLSDDRLARRCAAGDTAAFGVLFERHHQPVYRYCCSILRDPEEAADALQSTMEKALVAIGRRDPAAPLRAWLFRIAHNESVNLLRRRRSAAEPLEANALVAPDVAATAEQRDRLAQLVRDLRELPERQRSALLMREVSGLSHEEIAAAFGVSKGAVKQSIHEARSALHDEARGREMTCDAVCRTLGDGDGRTVRQRRIRAHLRGCDDCRAFNDGLRARRADLAVMTPMLPGPAAAAVLAAVTGGGAGGGGGLLAGLLGGGGASSALAKAAAVGAMTVTAGAGAVGITGLPGGGDGPGGAGGKAKARAVAPKPAPAAPARTAPSEGSARLIVAAGPNAGSNSGPSGQGGNGGGDERVDGDDRDDDRDDGPGDDREDRDEQELGDEDRSGPEQDDDEIDDDEPDSSGPSGGSGRSGGGREDDSEVDDRSGSGSSGKGGGEDFDEPEPSVTVPGAADEPETIEEPGDGQALTHDSEGPGHDEPDVDEPEGP